MSTPFSLELDDEVSNELAQLVPPDEQSRFANEALRAQLTLLKRRQAAHRLSVVRDSGPSVSTDEILRLLRRARDGAG